MRKKKELSPNVVTVDDRPLLRKKLRLAAESDWEAALDDIIKKFLSLFRERSPNFRIAPHKLAGAKQKRRTKRQEQLLLESGARMFDAFSTAMLAQSDPQRRKAYWDKHQRWERNYEKALFGKLSDSPEKRAVFKFLRDWCNAETHDSESAHLETVTLTLPLRIIHLMPLLAALNRRDAEFFEGLARAMRILRRYAKDTTDKWLLEHQEEIKRYPPDEIIKRFPQCPTKSVKRLLNELNRLGLEHPNKPRGQASPNYRFKKSFAELKALLNQA